MAEPRPRRGRPQLLSTAELRSRAISVLSRHGYDEVTMGFVATEIGVSLRTLHRHFPSKAGLVWGALDESFVRLRERLARTSLEVSVIAAIQAAIVETFTSMDDEDERQRERLRLIAVTPELQSAQPDAFRHWRDDIAEFAARRLGLEPDDLEPVAIGAAAQSATLAALTWWATHDEAGPAAQVVGRALSALDAEDRDRPRPR